MPTRTEELAAGAMQKAKSAKGAMEGLSGVFRKLMEEHGEVSALMKRLKMSDDPDKRRELFPKIREELLSHEKGELQEVYSVLHSQSGTRQIAEHHDREAQELEQQIDSLHAMSFDDPDWGAAFARLVELVQDHVREEENDFFPKAQRVLGDDQAEALQSRYEHAKREIMQQIS